MRHFEKQIREIGLENEPYIRELIAFEEEVFSTRSIGLSVGVLQRIFKNLLVRDYKFDGYSSIAIISDICLLEIVFDINKYDTIRKNLARLINNGFSWKRTPEGVYFWGTVYDFLNKTEKRYLKTRYDDMPLYVDDIYTPDPQDRAIANSSILL